MPEWISVWVAKIFGSEPVVKVMYVLIGWALLILFMPASFAASIYEKSNIPFSGQLCLFALAFIIVDATHRAISKWSAHRNKLAEAKKTADEIARNKLALRSVIDNLDEDEKRKLGRFFELGENSLWFHIDDVVVTSLSRRGLITCMHNRRIANGKTQMTYRINDKYFATAKEYFKGTTYNK